MSEFFKIRQNFHFEPIEHLKCVSVEPVQMSFVVGIFLNFPKFSHFRSLGGGRGGVIRFYTKKGCRRSLRDPRGSTDFFIIFKNFQNFRNFERPLGAPKIFFGPKFGYRGSLRAPRRSPEFFRILQYFHILDA